MKKTIAILLTFVLLITAASCGKSTSSGSAEKPAESEKASSESAKTEESTVEESVEEASEAAEAEETAAEEEPAEGNTKDEVVMVTGDEPSSGCDPLTGWGIRYNPLIQSKLVTVSADGTINLDLATDYQVSDDGREWTFTMRDDAYFTNGKQVAPEDVVFTFMTCKSNGSVHDLTNLENVEAVDDTTVKFTLVKPGFSFVFMVARLAIVPSDVYVAGAYSDDPIGSGPYKMVQWDKGQQMILERNEDYYGEKPQIRKLVLLFMDADAGFAAAQKGDVDITVTTSTLAGKTIDGFSMVNCETINAFGICLPVPADEGKTTEDGLAIGNNVTSDLAIRRAMGYGIDRDKLIQDAFNGYAKPASSNIDTLPWFNKETDVKNEPTGTDVGIAILEEGGWVDEDGDGVREKDGVKAAFKIIYPSGDTARQSMAMAVAEQAALLGIQIEATGASWDDIYNIFHAEAFTIGSGDVTTTEFIYEYYGPAAGKGWNNIPMYQNDAVDQDIDAAEASVSTEECYAYLQKAQLEDDGSGASVKGDAPYAWYCRKDNLYFIRDGLNIGDQPLHAHGYEGLQILGNITEWTWE